MKKYKNFMKDFNVFGQLASFLEIEENTIITRVDISQKFLEKIKNKK